MLRFRTIFPYAAILAGIVTFCMPPPARATFEIKFQGSSGTITYDFGSPTTTIGGLTFSSSTSVNGNEIDVNGTYGGNFNVHLAAADSNSQGGLGAPNFSQISFGSINVTNVGSGSQTLKVSVSDNAFTFPLSTGDHIVAAGSGTLVNTAAGAASDVKFSGSVSTSATLYGADISTPTGTVVAGAGGSAALAGAGNQVSGDFTAPNPYALTAVLQLDLAANGSVNFGGVTVQVITPEPGTLALACAGVFFVGGNWLRRRRGLAKV